MYSFSLTDELQNSINLRGLNCVITIVVYKKDNLKQLIAAGHLMNFTDKGILNES